jgi:hypothetical protein
VLFAAVVAIAFPVLLFGLGRYHWFLRDDWVFLNERNTLSFEHLFEPFNVHPVATPVAAYVALWNLFGLESYRPYQAGVIVLHLAAAVLLHRIMRSSGVRPWLAAVAAGSFVFFGPGAQNILWAFQIGFTGALTLGLLQLVLADHDGPFGRRDVFGVAAGILAVMSTGVGVTMALVVGLAVWGRRGWRIGFAHSAPLAAAYGAWYLVQRPETTSAAGSPSPEVLVEWVANAITGTFLALGDLRVVAVALALVTLAGLALAWWPVLRPGLDRQSWAARRRALRPLAIPSALLVGSLLFPAMTGTTRWNLGMEVARSSRYLHLGAALTLPALALGAEALARRWRGVTPVVAVLLLSAVPANLAAFEPEAFGERYMDERRRILTMAVAMPFARDVPPDVRPVPDPYDGDLTIGFLLEAVDDGRFDPYPYEIAPQYEQEMRIRLGLAQRRTGHYPMGCRTKREPVDLELDRGDVVVIAQPVRVTALDGGRPVSRPVLFNHRNGTELTAELDGLEVRLDPPGQSQTFSLCEA